MRSKIHTILFLLGVCCGHNSIRSLCHLKVEVVPIRFLKAIKGRKGLYEIRSEYEGNIYRVFCCFDEDNLVISFNGFQKKTQKLRLNNLTRPRL